MKSTVIANSSMLLVPGLDCFFIMRTTKIKNPPIDIEENAQIVESTE
jgi:hypothetical protein